MQKKILTKYHENYKPKKIYNHMENPFQIFPQNYKKKFKIENNNKNHRLKSKIIIPTSKYLGAKP